MKIVLLHYCAILLLLNILYFLWNCCIPKNDEEKEGALALANETEKALQFRDNLNSLAKQLARSCAEFLAARSYQGLDILNDNTLLELYLIGRSGRTAGYNDEKGKRQKLWSSHQSQQRSNWKMNEDSGIFFIIFFFFALMRTQVSVHQETCPHKQHSGEGIREIIFCTSLCILGRVWHAEKC